MTNHDTTGQPVTFHTEELMHIFTVLGALRPVIAQAQWGWPQETRDIVNKAFTLLSFDPDGTCRLKPGSFLVTGQPQLPQTTDQDGGN